MIPCHAGPFFFDYHPSRGWRKPGRCGKRSVGVAYLEGFARGYCAEHLASARVFGDHRRRYERHERTGWGILRYKPR